MSALSPRDHMQVREKEEHSTLVAGSDVVVECGVLMRKGLCVCKSWEVKTRLP